MLPHRPLEGIRVIDLSVVWAGPFTSEILADLGAEVIKVENIHAWQPATRSGRARPHKADVDESSGFPHGFPDHDPGSYAWERDPWFLPMLRNKKSVTINMRTPEGLEYFRRLVAKTDVFWENNVPETIEKLHVTYEELLKYNPRLIMLRAPAFGLSGPYKNRRGFGVHIEAFIGHTVLRGSPDMDPSTNTEIYAGDYLTGANGVFAVLAALHHRDRTGRGQLIELAQAENSSQMFPQAIMDVALNGRVHGTVGNRDVQGYAPNGVYQCAGDDRWIAISVREDDEWTTLCDIMEQPELATDPRFATPGAREVNQDDLDAILSAFCAKKDHISLMHRLQASGVPAGALLDPRDAMHSAQLWGRDFWYRLKHAFTGTYEWPGPPFRIPSDGIPRSLPPPGLGEHNEYVYKQVIGISDAEYEDLIARGEIGTVYDASIP
jgi:crotonobetainyl-CoA:carnitine CoA-transferase CaiB-like acyl-CoA transferase